MEQLFVLGGKECKLLFGDQQPNVLQHTYGTVSAQLVPWGRLYIAHTEANSIQPGTAMVGNG